jgi:signal transduction histidine kinase
MLLLADFIAANSIEILGRARGNGGTTSSAAPTGDELRDGIPLFLAQLVDRLRRATLDSAAMQESATRHGAALQKMGVTVAHVIRDYGAVCQAVTELAEAVGAPITTAGLHTLTRCLDEATANAVTEYVRQPEVSTTDDGTERLGPLAHELRNRLAAALLSFNVLKKGNVSLGGSTGAILGRCLPGLRDIVNRSLAEARLESGVQRRQRLSVLQLLADTELDVAMDAGARGGALIVTRGERGVEVEADPQILAAPIASLLQHAAKFRRQNGRVVLRATATSEWVTIEVEDECGGRPAGSAETHLLPFPQKSGARTGLGLGRAIARKGVAASGGRLRVRKPPKHGVRLLGRSNARRPRRDGRSARRDRIPGLLLTGDALD